ncbi:DUF551 domain-containing protein [Enterobacter hormaechei]|uniref:DUF551 domain-containing protein n=1 Tax=Enterobacter hormaechei TaxID=158836 RepID=UPI001CC2951A|nr:DUF551 domain-containing protein [Enterobacter hormaechei]
MTNSNLTDERLSALIRVARDSLELYEMELPVIDDVMLALAELQQRRAAMLQGAEPVSNRDELTDGWVACSKRMPSPSTGVIVAAPWQSAPCGYAMKWATNCPGHPDADIDGWIIPGASWSPTHWMPLPAAPQQEDIIC